MAEADTVSVIHVRPGVHKLVSTRFVYDEGVFAIRGVGVRADTDTDVATATATILPVGGPSPVTGRNPSEQKAKNAAKNAEKRRKGLKLVQIATFILKQKDDLDVGHLEACIQLVKQAESGELTSRFTSTMRLIEDGSIVLGSVISDHDARVEHIINVSDTKNRSASYVMAPTVLHPNKFGQTQQMVSNGRGNLVKVCEELFKKHPFEGGKAMLWRKTKKEGSDRNFATLLHFLQAISNGLVDWMTESKHTATYLMWGWLRSVQGIKALDKTLAPALDILVGEVVENFSESVLSSSSSSTCLWQLTGMILMKCSEASRVSCKHDMSLSESLSCIRWDSERGENPTAFQAFTRKVFDHFDAINDAIKSKLEKLEKSSSSSSSKRSSSSSSSPRKKRKVREHESSEYESSEHESSEHESSAVIATEEYDSSEDSSSSRDSDGNEEYDSRDSDGNESHNSDSDSSMEDG
jgi:hypothetical protein